MKKAAFFLSTLIVIFLFISCKKNTFNSTDFNTVSGQSLVKVNVFSFYRNNPNLQIKINDIRVSNTLTAATPFPGGGLNTGGSSTSDYLSINAGSTKFSFSIPKAGVSQDSIPLGEATVNINPDTKYSFYFADTAANTTTLLVLDTLRAPDSGYSKFKFVNLIPDLPSADLYIGTVRVASGVPYKGVSSSFILPTNNPSTTWAIRAAGGTTNLATYASASSLGNQRVYTVLARGYNAITATTDPRVKKVSLIYNQ